MTTDVNKLNRQVLAAYRGGDLSTFQRLFDTASQIMSDRDFERLIVEVDKIEDEKRRRERQSWDREESWSV